MENSFEHDIELHSPRSFKILLDHEVSRSRRYGDPLTLLRLTLKTEPSDPQILHSAEVFTINVLNLRLRDADIPCKKGSEFLVLMPSTDEQGGRTACERLERLFKTEPQTYDRVSFELSAFIGMATLPGDGAISGKKLLQYALKAQQQARATGHTNAVVFSEMNH
jgi:hypothetical protein